MKNFQVASIQLAPKGARPAWFAAAAGGATQAAVGRRSATATSRRSASTTWVSVWPAVSRYSKQQRRHGGRGGCRSLTLPKRGRKQTKKFKKDFYLFISKRSKWHFNFLQSAFMTTDALPTSSTDFFPAIKYFLSNGISWNMAAILSGHFASIIGRAPLLR